MWRTENDTKTSKPTFSHHTDKTLLWVPMRPLCVAEDGWLSLILNTGVITNWCWILHDKSFFILCYDCTMQALNLDLKSGTRLSKSQESLSVEIRKSISGDPKCFNKQRSTMSYLLWCVSISIGHIIYSTIPHIQHIVWLSCVMLKPLSEPLLWLQYTPRVCEL